MTEIGNALVAHHLLHHQRGVRQTGQGPAIQDGLVRQFTQPLLQGPEGAEQIAAVHGGDVAGFERFQGLDIIPVEEMSLMAPQTADGRHGARELVGGLVEGQVAAIIGPQGTGQPEADIGRAGAHGQTPFIGYLKVVGRQPGSLLADKG